VRFVGGGIHARPSAKEATCYSFCCCFFEKEEENPKEVVDANFFFFLASCCHFRLTVTGGRLTVFQPFSLRLLPLLKKSYFYVKSLFFEI
jgi:hypothetical protein